MSSLLSSGLYIYDSRENYSSRSSFMVLSEVFQNILDDHYRDPKKLYLDTIQLNSTKLIVWAVVQWISLWNEEVELYDKNDIAKYIRWVRWRIGIIYELDGKKMITDLGDIRSITQAHTIDRVNIHTNESDATSISTSAYQWEVLQNPMISTLPHVSH
jgi:hypothetical protein